MFAICILSTTALLPIQRAFANPEPTATYDAKVVGMGGVAAPTIDSAAALYHNPARLSVLEDHSLTITWTSLLVDLSAPFAGPGSEQSSGLIYAPLGFAGGATRLTDDVVAGLGAYITTGFGGGFDSVPCVGNGACEMSFMPSTKQEVTLFVLEIAAAASVEITDTLSVGLALRLPYGEQSVNALQQDHIIGQWQRGIQDLKGLGIPGVLVGANWAPARWLTLAFAYRSKTYVDMRGTTDIALGSETYALPTTTRWYTPHMFRLGAAWHPLDRLTVATDIRLQLHEEANKEQRFSLDTSPFPVPSLVPKTTVAEFKWRNVFSAALAVEGKFWHNYFARIAFSTSNSASNPETLTPFSPPPSIGFGAYVGVGYRAKPIAFDLGFGYTGQLPHDISENGPRCVPGNQRYDQANDILYAQGGCAGRYDVTAIFVSASLSHQF